MWSMGRELWRLVWFLGEVEIPTSRAEGAREMGHPTRDRPRGLFFLCGFFGRWLLAGVFFRAKHALENLVDILQLAWQVEGVFNLRARNFAGDLFVGED